MTVHLPLTHWLCAALHQQYGARAVYVIRSALQDRRHKADERLILCSADSALRCARNGCGAFIDIQV